MRHQITICTSCRHKGSEHRPGPELIARLSKALHQGRDRGLAPFEVAGVACMAGCDHPCTVSYQAPEKATYLFGNIDSETDIDDLVAFAQQYSALEDGWCSSTTRPGKLRTATLARVPAIGFSKAQKKAQEKALKKVQAS
ncbi:MAG: DUF1636 domain-containing protein [Pseudomonadota bacterium]